MKPEDVTDEMVERLIGKKIEDADGIAFAKGTIAAGVTAAGAVVLTDAERAAIARAAKAVRDDRVADVLVSLFIRAQEPHNAARTEAATAEEG